MAQISFKDVIGCYIGCETNYGKLCGFTLDRDGNVSCSCEMTDGGRVVGLIDDLKPILRKLESMTEEESVLIYDILNPEYADRKEADDVEFKVDFIRKAVIQQKDWITGIGWVKIIPAILKMEFDLFQLIDSNQAIDKNSQL